MKKELGCFCGFLLAALMTSGVAFGKIEGKLGERLAKIETSAATSRSIQHLDCEIEVNELPDGLVEIKLNREDCVYERGEYIEVTITSSKPGYLYLVGMNPAGKSALLIPNHKMTNNWIEAGQATTYPSQGMAFKFRVGGTLGNEKFFAFVSDEKIDVLDRKGSKGDAASLTEADLKAFSAKLKENDEQKRKASKSAGGDRTLVVVGRPVAAGSKAAGNSKDIEIVSPPETPAETEAGAASQDVDVAVAEDVERSFIESSLDYQTVEKGQRGVAQSKRVIVVSIGVNKYKEKRFNQLTCCVDDATAFRNMCVNTLKIDRDNTLLVTDEDVTLDGVRKIFTVLLKEVTRPGDVIYVYWSGHGSQAGSVQDATAGSFDQCLVPHDGVFAQPYKTMLMEYTFEKWINDLQGREVLMFLDACHSGGMTAYAKGVSGSKGLFDEAIGSDLQKADVQPFAFGCGEGRSKAKSLARKGLYVICSSTENELSFEGEKLSVMTNFMIDAIKKGDATSQKDLKKVIKPRVQKYVADSYRYVRQTVVDQDDLEGTHYFKKR